MQKTGLIGILAAIWAWVGEASGNILGITPTGVLLATLGAWLSASYDFGDEAKKPISRKKIYINALTHIMVAISFVSVAPHALDLKWYSEKLEGSLVFLVALFARHLIALFIKLLPEAGRKWLKLGEYNTKKDTNEKDNIL